MKRSIGVGLTALLATATLSAALVAPAQAGSDGRRNTALVLGGVAAYEAINGNTAAAIAAGAGAVYSYNRYEDARDREDRWYNYRDRRYRASDRDWDRRYDRDGRRGYTYVRDRDWDRDRYRDRDRNWDRDR